MPTTIYRTNAQLLYTPVFVKRNDFYTVCIRQEYRSYINRCFLPLIFQGRAAPGTSRCTSTTRRARTQRVRGPTPSVRATSHGTSPSHPRYARSWSSKIVFSKYYCRTIKECLVLVSNDRMQFDWNICFQIEIKSKNKTILCKMIKVQFHLIT